MLEQIYVDGTTDTPDFQVSRSGHPLDLSTTFSATVDGTNGDTYLHPVEAHFGKLGNSLLAQGRVEGGAASQARRLLSMSARTGHASKTSCSSRCRDRLQWSDPFV